MATIPPIKIELCDDELFRDNCAMLAMERMLERVSEGTDVAHIAQRCYWLADAMLEERTRRRQGSE